MGGCCGCLLLVVIGVFAVTVGGGVALFTGLRSSGAYTEAVALAKGDPRVIELLGEPIETGWLMSGSIQVNGPAGDADLAIPLSGPKGKATLYAVATKTAGEWSFEVLEVAPENEDAPRIDLLSGNLEEEAPVG